MKRLITLFLLINTCYATTYPVKSITELNSLVLKSGDVIQIQGTLNLTSIYVPVSGVTYTGGSLSGLTTLKLTPVSGNVYSVPLDVKTLNLVTVDGSVKGMGRYPNKDYLNYESHLLNSSITDRELTGNWIGAEIVIRKQRWILDRHTVTAQNGTTLVYNALGTYGNNNVYSPYDGNGYFIQNSLNTLDQNGEWFYDKTNKRLYVYLDNKESVVKVSTLDVLINATGKSNINFTGVTFEGGNLIGLSFTNCSNIALTDCTIKSQGGNGIYGLTSTNITVKGGSIKNILNDGIYYQYGVNGSTVEGVSIDSCGMIAGAGPSGDGTYQGMYIIGDKLAIRNNRVTNSGYNAINFMGSNVVVERNYVDGYCSVKDDGGGIYTFTFSGVSTNRVIWNNIILNGIGAQKGAESFKQWENFGKAAGIYCDQATQNVLISGNTIANTPWGGLFISNAKNIQVVGNTVYNAQNQLHFLRFSGDNTENIARKGNKFIAKTAFQRTLWYESLVNPADLTTLGTSDDNYFISPVDNQSIHLQVNNGGIYQNLTLEGYKSTHKQDINSTKIIAPEIRLEYNDTFKPKDIPLNRAYVDVEGRSYTDKITLKPFESIVLLPVSRSLVKTVLYYNDGSTETK